MPRYCIQYDEYHDGEWGIETYTIRADTVEITDGIAHFRHSVTGEAFLVTADNLVAAWTQGDNAP